MAIVLFIARRAHGGDIHTGLLVKDKIVIGMVKIGEYVYNFNKKDAQALVLKKLPEEIQVQ